MKLDIILALVLVTTTCSSAHAVVRREVAADPAEEEASQRETPRRLDESKRTERRNPFVFELCTHWLEDFYKFLVVSEKTPDGKNRPITYTDMTRFFQLIDGNDDGKISAREFAPAWITASQGMSPFDTNALFYMFFTIVGDVTDPDHITRDNIKGIWDLFGGTVPTEEQGAAEEEEADEERKTSLSEEDFNTVWKAIILPALPHHGCPPAGADGEGAPGDSPDMDREDVQMRPDVYGYYKRKRK